MSGAGASAEPAPVAAEPRAFGAACVAALAAVVAHAFALGLGFHADDFHYLRDAYRAEVARDAAERGLPGPPSAPAEPTLDGSANEGGRGTLIYRPLLDVFWAALIRAQGRTDDGGLRPPSPLYEHGFSVLLKALTCFVVVFLARALGAPPGGPLFAGLVCALHAAPMNATTWVAARGDLCWALAGAFAWLSLERSSAPRGGGPPPGAAAFAVRLSVAAFVMQLGALGKETALAAAGLIGGAAVCARLVGRLSTARTVAWIVAMAAVVGATFALRHASYGEAAQRYAGRSGAPTVEALRDFVRDEIPRLWKLYLGGRTVGPRGAEGHAAAATAAAFVAGAALFAGAAARLRAAFRCVLYLAAGVLSTYPVMIVVKGPEDEYVSREFTGYAVALAVVAGVLFPRGFAGRAIAYGALAAVAAMFALEAAEYVEVDRGARTERERLDAALSEAGPGAELSIVHGGATTGGLMVPPESYAAAAVAPFGRATVARQYSTLERAWTTRDAAAPDRLLFSRGVPTALALARNDGPGAWRRFDAFPLVRPDADAPDVMSAASESDGFARLRTPAGAPPANLRNVGVRVLVERRRPSAGRPRRSGRGGAERRDRVRGPAGGRTVRVRSRRLRRALRRLDLGPRRLRVGDPFGHTGRAPRLRRVAEGRRTARLGRRRTADGARPSVRGAGLAVNRPHRCAVSAARVDLGVATDAAAGAVRLSGVRGGSGRAPARARRRGLDRGAGGGAAAVGDVEGPRRSLGSRAGRDGARGLSVRRPCGGGGDGRRAAVGRDAGTRRDVPTLKARRRAHVSRSASASSGASRRARASRGAAGSTDETSRRT
jgi:hypothetical protein